MEGGHFEISEKYVKSCPDMSIFRGTWEISTHIYSLATVGVR